MWFISAPNLVARMQKSKWRIKMKRRKRRRNLLKRAEMRKNQRQLTMKKMKKGMRAICLKTRRKAIEEESVEEVRRLIQEEGANASQRYTWVGKLIHYRGMQMVPEIEGRNGCWTALAAAVRTDSRELVEVIRGGADPNEPFFWVLHGVGEYSIVTISSLVEPKF
jgi:hypothetical protein